MQGYNLFSAFPNVPNNPLIWKRAWNVKSLLKIDMFSSTVVHGSILIGDNIEKIGFVGPVARISPCYRGRNGSLLPIGQKGRFLLVGNCRK